MSYEFTVGSRVLHGGGALISGLGNSLHVCLLLGNDLFEYGVKDDSIEDDRKTFRRLKNVGKSKDFNWSNNFEIEGVSKVSPDELEQEIIKSKEWGPGTFDSITHNCHNFVKFCCDIIEPDITIMKVDVAPMAPFYENRLIRTW